MRPAPLLSTLLLSLTTLACGSSGSDTTADTSAASTSTAGSTTATPTTTNGDPSTGSSVTTDPGADPTGDLSTGTLTTGEPTTGALTTGEATTGETTTDETTGAAEELPPIDSAEVLEAWLAGGAYKAWAAESKVHASTGPHGGNVRTFVNAIALGSLAAQQTEHPQDTALVKELYGDSMDTVIGYAVMRKTAPQSEGGATWYWYERIDANVYADGLDVALCSGCHGGGADYILTPYPLQ